MWALFSNLNLNNVVKMQFSSSTLKSRSMISDSISVFKKRQLFSKIVAKNEIL